MTSPKQLNFKLTICNALFGLLLLITTEVSCQYQPPMMKSDKNVPANNDSAKVEEVSNEIIQELSERNLNFAFNIYQLMADEEDMVLSPFCISVALTMTSFGARNNTLKQLNDALDLHGFPDHILIAKAYKSILKSLDLKGDITLVILNRILIDKAYKIKEPFKEIAEDEFRTIAESVNFSDDGQDLTKGISEGLDQIAKNKFKDLSTLSQGTKSMGAVLVSAIYFKGKWAQAFRNESTKPEQFRVSNECTQTVDMMNTEAQYYFAEDSTLDSKILKMECSGSRLVVFFILPKTLEGLKTMKKRLNTEWFEELNNKMGLQTVKVKLPKFNGNYMKELSPELKKMQMYDLEDEASVDLSDIAEPQVSGSRLFVQKLLYAADVTMGEEGAQAAALPVQGGVGQALGVGASAENLGGASGSGAGGGEGRPPPAEFFADHPFVFIIYDTATNFILFMGNVDCPVYV